MQFVAKVKQKIWSNKIRPKNWPFRPSSVRVSTGAAGLGSRTVTSHTDIETELSETVGLAAGRL